ncbi:TPM domain-containing protein [Horticoccus luteus]|uniref:TPM domain-containing protein n=1 Tax=Horticoccus luteus TaxID=2862869 RepID=A0A8F9TX89_9BACT|nr:TPM domain-containing protein [Horticoccus luteus]
MALAWLALLVIPFFVRAAEVIPPAPRDHFNDYAGLVSADAARSLDAQLTQFERDTSTQLVVAIFPTMQSDSSVDDYAVRVAQAWGVGRKDRKNGAVLFCFMQEHKIYLTVGYGLEGALPDATAKRIIENEITPQFRAGHFEAGLRAGITAIEAATRGEYKGTGRTAPSHSRGLPPGALFGIFLVIVIFSVFARQRSRRSDFYGRRGRRTFWMGPGPWGGGGSSGGGGWSGGGGGGSFSGGGGSFGGGGAGGSW